MGTIRELDGPVRVIDEATAPRPAVGELVRFKLADFRTSEIRITGFDDMQPYGIGQGGGFMVTFNPDRLTRRGTEWEGTEGRSWWEVGE